MIKKLGITLLFLALGSVSALAADFNGKWTGDVQGRNGNTQTLTFDFHVDGTTLTGKITTPRGDVDITNGKVDGDNISFDQVLNFNGNSFTISYQGKADGADGPSSSRAHFGGGGDRPPQDVRRQARHRQCRACRSSSARAACAAGYSASAAHRHNCNPAVTEQLHIASSSVRILGGS